MSREKKLIQIHLQQKVETSTRRSDITTSETPKEDNYKSQKESLSESRKGGETNSETECRCCGGEGKGREGKGEEEVRIGHKKDTKDESKVKVKGGK